MVIQVMDQSTAKHLASITEPQKRINYDYQKF